MFVGIDLGASAIDVVAVGSSLDLVGAAVLAPDLLDDLLELVAGAECVAIDAPSALSTAPHLDDASLSPKFRPARCAEIALGRDHGVWVPWVTPTTDPVAWMSLGLRLYTELDAASRRCIEVYPHAIFQALAGRRLPKKTTEAGIVARAAALREAGVRATGLEAWSHHRLDAAAGALTAYRASFGAARPVTCGHDGSSIWLP